MAGSDIWLNDRPLIQKHIKTEEMKYKKVLYSTVGWGTTSKPQIRDITVSNHHYIQHCLCYPGSHPEPGKKPVCEYALRPALAEAGMLFTMTSGRRVLHELTNGVTGPKYGRIAE